MACRHCGLCLREDVDSKRVNPNRLRDILELDGAKIADCEIEPALHLTIGVFGEADSSLLANTFQPRGNVDAIAHEVAVRLFDDIAQVNADAKFDALVGRDARVSLDHVVLHFERSTHRVDDAAKLDDTAITGALDDAAMMYGNCGIN
jgi:hypothetical protein